MFFKILAILILTQTVGIKVTQGVIQKGEGKITEGTVNLAVSDNMVGGVFMGISPDSNYAFINEVAVKLDKKRFEFSRLPKVGDVVHIKMEAKGNELLGVSAYSYEEIMKLEVR